MPAKRTIRPVARPAAPAAPVPPTVEITYGTVDCYKDCRRSLLAIGVRETLTAFYAAMAVTVGKSEVRTYEVNLIGRTMDAVSILANS